MSSLQLGDETLLYAVLALSFTRRCACMISAESAEDHSTPSTATHHSSDSLVFITTIAGQDARDMCWPPSVVA